MKIGELFQTRVEEKIEPVIKVNETADERKLAAEIGSYVVTPTIEKYLAAFLDHYTDTFQLDTTEIGLWISGYFGSGKSHLAKVMGLLAENRRLAGATAAERFEPRIVSPTDDARTIKRALTRLPQCDTQVLAFNINTLADSKATPLPKLLLSQYYQARGYGANVLYARVIEAELDSQGRLPQLRAAVEASAGRSWADIQKNPTFYQQHLYRGASQVAPEHFATPESVRDALQKAQAGELFNVGFLIDTLLHDLETRERATRRKQRLLLVMDESGQWIEGDRDRLNALQSLVEEAAVKGQGRIWIVVTTHSDMGSVLTEARVLEADMKKIEARFRYKFPLTTENIELVLEDRLFRKSLPGRQELDGVYKRRGGVLRDVGELRSDRTLAFCTADKFATYYPFFPYQVGLIPEIVKSLRSRGGRGEQLSGSTRTLLAITQDILRAGRRPYLDQETGLIVSFDEVYYNLAGEGEVSPDIRDELSRILDRVPGATPLTQQVAEVLYLVRELPYIARSRENLARLLARDIDDSVASLVQRIEPELDALRRAKMVGQIGDEYEFLTGEKRTFEEFVSARESELRAQDKEQGLATNFFHQPGRAWWQDWVPFQTIPFEGVEFPFKLVLDDVTVPQRAGDITLCITTPLGRHTLRSVEDSSLRPESLNTLFLFSADVPRFDEHLKRYLAMKEVIGLWTGDAHRSEEARRLARERERDDLPKVRQRVLDDLYLGLSRAQLVFRGSSRAVSVPTAKKLAEVLRAELGGFMAAIYPKLERCPVRVANEEAAIRDVLAGGTAHRDVVALKLFDKAGKISPAAVLLDAVRVHLADQQARSRRVLGADLLTHFTAPPYGWDGNAVRVAVAALVRSGAVKLIVNKKPFTNPADPELVDAIRVSRSFDKVELVLEETEVDPDELADVRKLLRRIAKRRDIDETPAALASVARELSVEVDRVADRVRVWAAPANFPLPSAFTEAVDAWAKVGALTNPVHCVHEVAVDAERLERGYATVLETAEFQRTDGAVFVEMARLARDLVAVEHRLETASPVRTFLAAFEHGRSARTLGERETWRQVRALEASARLELAVMLNTWRDAAREVARSALGASDAEAAELQVEASVLSRLQQPLRAFVQEIDAASGTARLSALAEIARQHADRLINAVRAEGEARRRLDPVKATVAPQVARDASFEYTAPAPVVERSGAKAREIQHLTSVRIDAFRGLSGLQLNGLGRVNLIVSRNNGGKTSLLEAVSACCLPLNARAWMDLIRRRGLGDPSQPLREQFLWLFPHRADAPVPGEIHLQFQRKDGPACHLRAKLGPIANKVKITLEEVRPGQPQPAVSTCDFDLSQPLDSLPAGRADDDVPTVFITPQSHRSELFQILALEELGDDDTLAQVLRLLRQLDPDILAITPERGGERPTVHIAHKRRGQAPISTFGDGLRRTLALALALMRCRGGGALMIDEIESGIHYSALREVYLWLVQAADKYAVQLFITTHSLEAIDALLSAAEDGPDQVATASVYRLWWEGETVSVATLSGADAWELRREGGFDLR